MRSEMMMFTTARTQLVEQIIRPALVAGKTVVLDRYVLSTVVYQGHAGNLDANAIRQVNDFATDGLWPDQTFILDLPTESAMQRLGDNLDRMESRGSAYFEKVRAGFLAEAEKQSGHICHRRNGRNRINRPFDPRDCSNVIESRRPASKGVN